MSNYQQGLTNIICETVRQLIEKFGIDKPIRMEIGKTSTSFAIMDKDGKWQSNSIEYPREFDA